MPVVEDFRSWGEWLGHLDSHEQTKTKRNASHEVGKQGWTDRTEFTRTKDFPEAMRLARYGWDEGTHLVERYSHAFFDNISSLVEVPEPYYDVAGGQIDIGRYVSDQPDCYMQMRTHYQESPGQRIIRLEFNTTASAGVEGDVLMAKGGATVALVELLELAGNRVEIVMSRCTQQYESFLMLKEADQPLDLPRLAFALAHPSCLRRLGFRAMELAVPDLDSGYGYPKDSSRKQFADIYVGTAFGRDVQWNHVETATKWLKDELGKQGVELRDDGTAAKVPLPEPTRPLPAFSKSEPRLPDPDWDYFRKTGTRTKTPTRTGNKPKRGDRDVSF